MGTILDRIVETKRGEVAERQDRLPLSELTRMIGDAEPPRDFHAALQAEPAHGIHLIAEIKKKSPSAGLIRPDFDPAGIAGIYHRHGASGLSVLTDEPYFAGRLEYIAQVKQAVPLPVLRKDFMIDPYQIHEARAFGADAILLIGEVLPPARLADMLELAGQLDLTALIEVHSPETLTGVLGAVDFAIPRRVLLGINNRDLTIQKTDLATTGRLAPQVPAGVPLVSESGIKTHADVQRLIALGARAMLVGETLMKAPDIAAAIDELLTGSSAATS